MLEYFSWYDLNTSFDVLVSNWENYDSVPSRDYEWINDRLAIGKEGGAEYTLDVNGSARIIGSALATTPSHVAVQGGSDNVFKWQTWGTFVNNLAASGGVGGGNIGGTGSAGYVAKWIAGATIANSILYDDGSAIGVGKTPLDGKTLDVAGDARVQSDLAASTLSIGNVAKANVSSATITDASNQIPQDDLEYILSELWYKTGIAYNQRYHWDGGATNLNAVLGRQSLGLGTAALRNAEDTLTNGSNLPDGAAIINYINGRGFITDPNDSVQPSELDGTFSTIGLLKRTGASTYTTITDNSANWNTAYTERRQWDGGNTNLNPAAGRSSLQLDSYYAAVGHNHGTGTAGYIAKWQTNELLERSVISESANLLNLATSAVLQGFNYYHKNVRTEWIQYDGAYRAYLKFPASTALAGSLRLTITIPYIAYGTSAPGGTLIYEYGFIGNSSGTAYVNKRECKSTIGNTADYVVAGDIVWHTTDSCWAIPIYNLQKRNYPLVSIDYYSWYDLDSTFTITCSSWETYSMVPSRDYSWINDRLAVGKSGGAAFTLDVNGDARANKIYFPDIYGDKLLLKSNLYRVNLDVNEFNLFSDRYFTMSSDTNTDAFIFDADTGSLTSEGNIIINGIYYGDGSGLSYVDADTLEGRSATDFATSTHNHGTGTAGTIANGSPNDW